MKVALISGCSSGLGKELAKALHSGSWDTRRAQRFRVFATARNLQDLADLKLEGIDTLQLDVTDQGSVRKVVEQVLREAGRIDLLVCNAGIVKYAPIVEQDLDEVKSIIDTNTMGALLCVRAVAPIMIQQRSGTLAVTGSIAASVTAPFSCAYTASKAAVHKIFEGLRMELAPYNIEVSVIEGGFFQSSLFIKGNFDVGKYAPGRSLWSRAAQGIKAIAEFVPTRAKTTSEGAAKAAAKQLSKQHPPAHFFVGDEVYSNRLMGFIYYFISPNFVHNTFRKMFGLDQKW